jgi:hypothetical protein
MGMHMLSALMANHTWNSILRAVWIIRSLDFLDAWVSGVFVFAFCGESFDAELY